MTRGTVVWTEERIQTRELEGRGKGTKEAYVPWIDIHDFSSRGNTHRFLGAYIKRPHLLFSDLELNAFTLCEWSLRYSDIREQMPLDRSLTREIAELLRIPHPTYRGTDVSFVMTTDLFLTDAADESKLYAVNVKPQGYLNKERELELLEIQRYYYAAMGIPHQIYVLTDAATAITKTIQWARAAFLKSSSDEPYEGCYREHAQSLESELIESNSDVPLVEYCRLYDSRCRLQQDTALQLARSAIFARRLEIPMESSTPSQTPLFLISGGKTKESL